MGEGRRAWLLRIHPGLDGDRVAVIPFEGARMTIGRSRSCSIKLDVHGVSAEHARIERTRTGGVLRVVDLGSRNGTMVGGWKVGPEGADCEEGSVLRVGEALFVYRDLTDEEAADAALPPLPGPVNTRHAPLATAIRRVQRKVTQGGPIWLCGPAGAGRSVLETHLRGLAGERRAAWITGGLMDFRVSEEVPDDADPARTVVCPPLRDRVEDVMVLTISLCSPRTPPIGPRLLEALHLYDWPGNIRELRVVLERAFHPKWGAMPGGLWDVDAFPDVLEYLQRRPQPKGRRIPRSPRITEPEDGVIPSSHHSTELRERLETHHWKLFATAESYGVSRATLLQAMARVGLRGPAYGYAAAGPGVRFPPGLAPGQR